MNRNRSIPSVALATALLSLLAIARSAAAGTVPLVITEVMAVPAKATNNFRGTEYWELTNFGNDAISLNGYGFRDADPTHNLVKSAFNNLVIRAGESIVFFRTGPTSPSISNFTGFRNWWGESKLPPYLQARTWDTFGLSGWDGDEVRLYNDAGQLVDRVQFGRSRLGRSFSYESDSGLFGVLSVDGVDGAIRAELTDDSGSPGWTTGPVPVRLLQEPSEKWADLGSTLSMQVFVAGLPRPEVQWLFQDTPVLGGVGDSLTLFNVNLTHVGVYKVWLTNIFSSATGQVATVNVNTNPFAPIIVHPSNDVAIFSGQTARFTVEARGLPLPSFQWSANGQDIVGATEPSLEVREVSQANSGILYSVRVWNSLGSTNASARLTIVERPDLRFTEIMASPTDEENNRHFDWFEVTNFGTNTVNLFGWRFADEPSFGGAFTVTNHLEIRPTESVIFAERLDLRLFSLWWGEANLPRDLQVFVYSGIGLKSFGDTLYLWNPAAEDPYDYVATALWAGATRGVSFELAHKCEPDFGCEDEAERESVNGTNGAFQAATSPDIGSPGYSSEPPLRILSIQTGSGQVKIQCRVSAGQSYRLLRANGLSAPAWTPLAGLTATNNVLVLEDSLASTEAARFYRVEKIGTP
jgi:hypothetical protein